MRTKQLAQTKQDTLNGLCRSVAFPDVVVQIGASVQWPEALTEKSPMNNLSIGLLHLGPGNHGMLEHLTPWLAKGAIILFECATEGSEAYDYTVGWAARGYLSSPVHARHWEDLLVCTYFGGLK